MNKCIAVCLKICLKVQNPYFHLLNEWFRGVTKDLLKAPMCSYMYPWSLYVPLHAPMYPYAPIMQLLQARKSIAKFAKISRDHSTISAGFTVAKCD